MSKLTELQQEFARCFGQFTVNAFKQGHSFVLGEAWRTKEQAEIYASQGKGIAKSLHRKRLAVDIIVFVDGKPSWDAEDYRGLGELWKSMHPLACWGGDFKNRDAFHFSFTYGGVR